MFSLEEWGECHCECKGSPLEGYDTSEPPLSQTTLPNIKPAMSDDFGSGTSGASKHYPAQASSLRKGGHVLIKDRPCKIVEMTTSKTGKHGHAKIHLVGLDIFTQKKYEDICPSTHNMNVPNVKREDFQFLDIDEDGFLSLLGQDGSQKDDVQVTDQELLKEIKNKEEKGEEFMISVLSSMDEEKPCATKNMSTK